MVRRRKETNHVEEREVFLLEHNLGKLLPLVVSRIDSGGLRESKKGSHR